MPKKSISVTLVPENISFSGSAKTIKGYEKKVRNHVNQVGKVIGQTIGTYTVKYGKNKITAPKSWFAPMEEFAKGGKAEADKKEEKPVEQVQPAEVDDVDLEKFQQMMYKRIGAFMKERKPSVEVWKNLSLHDKETSYVYRCEPHVKKVGGKLFEVVLVYYRGQYPSVFGDIAYNYKLDRVRYFIPAWSINIAEQRFGENGEVVEAVTAFDEEYKTLVKGSIKNQYAGKKGGQVWGEMTFDQRTHFLKDHHLSPRIKNKNYSATEYADFAAFDYSKLPDAIKDEFVIHVEGGQYAEGGTVTREQYNDMIHEYDMLTEQYQDLKTKEEKEALNKKISELEGRIHKYEHGYAEGGSAGGGLLTKEEYNKLLKKKVFYSDRTHSWVCEMKSGFSKRHHTEKEAIDSFERDYGKMEYSDDDPKMAEGGNVDNEQVDEVLQAYIDAALWSSTDDEDEPLDRNYDSTDLVPGLQTKMRADVEQFISENEADIKESELTNSQIGHALWLSRNGHGAGFFDYSNEACDRLQEAAKKIGVINLYETGDRQIDSLQGYAKGGSVEDEEDEYEMYPSEPDHESDCFITELSTGEYIVSAESGMIGRVDKLSEAFKMLREWKEQNDRGLNTWIESLDGNYILIDDEGEELAKGGKAGAEDYSSSIQYFIDRYEKEIESGDKTKDEIIAQAKKEIDDLKKMKPSDRLANYKKSLSISKALLKHFSGKGTKSINDSGIEVGKTYEHESYGKVKVAAVRNNTGDKSDRIPYVVHFFHGEKGKSNDGRSLVQQSASQGINGFKLDTTGKYDGTPVPVDSADDNTIPDIVKEKFKTVKADNNFSVMNLKGKIWRRDNRTGEIIALQDTPQFRLPGGKDDSFAKGGKVKSYKDAIKIPKGGAVNMDSDNLQSTAAETIASMQGVRPEVVYDWANKHKIDLVTSGHVLSNPKNTRLLLEDVLSDKYQETKKLLSKDKFSSRSKLNFAKGGEAGDFEYANIVFMQSQEDAEEPLRILEEEGQEAAIKYLSQWDNGEYYDTREDDGGGTSDTRFKSGDYILIYNTSLGYIGLVKKIKKEFAKGGSVEDSDEVKEAKNKIEALAERWNRDSRNEDGNRDIKDYDTLLKLEAPYKNTINQHFLKHNKYFKVVDVSNDDAGNVENIFLEAPDEFKDENKYLYKINNNSFHSNLVGTSNIDDEINMVEKNIRSKRHKELYKNIPELLKREPVWLKMLKAKKQDPYITFLSASDMYARIGND